VTSVAGEIERRLRLAGSPARATGEKAYLKSDLKFYGVTVPAVRRTVLAVWRESGPLGRQPLLDAAKRLWSTRIHECRMAVVELLELGGDELEAGDVPMLEGLLRESRTWALVDPLAANVVGPLDERVGIGPDLERWATDPDFWMRRSALLAHLMRLGSGEGNTDRFLRFADVMLDESEFFIRKAVGWGLRELGKKRPDVVQAWIAPRVHRASGVTMREAVKPLDAITAGRLMAAYRRH
jgi:3-methyladenine DNA glycosylase AlkD